VGFQENVALDANVLGAAGIPTLTLHSLDRSSARLLTQPYRDTGLDRIDWDHCEAAPPSPL
jgi:hypothetical protein